MKYLTALLLLLSACQNAPVEFKGVAMTIPYRVVVETTQKREKVEKVIATCFATVDAHYNNWNPHSEISLLSTLPLHQKHPVSPGLYHLLLLAQKIHLLSGKRFDPTVAPLAKAWKERQVISSETIGFEHLHLEDGTCLLDEKVTIDLGGIAKGYGVDLLVESLQKEGFEHIYVEWGGEIRTLGSHPAARPWLIAVRGMGTLSLQSGSLATSGNYFQVWEKEGELYTHIIDPRTRKPLPVQAQSIASVTVLAPTCAEADALATALMLFESVEEAMQWVATLENVQCWVGAHGET